VLIQSQQGLIGKPLDVDAVFAAKAAHEFLGQERHILGAVA
jgi:hypothetical protein